MEKKKRIILVDDQITNLTVGTEVLSGTYEVFPVPSGEKMFKLLKRVIPDMILLDLEMPQMNGYEVLKILKSTPETRDIPVIFLTARTDTGSELEGLSLGAVDYVSKPFSAPLLLKRIELHLLLVEQKAKLQRYNDNLAEMVREKTETILELQTAIMETVAELVERRDHNTGGHVGRTRNYLRILIDEMVKEGIYSEQSSSWDLEQLLMSAQLHDVGKIAISDDILHKPDRLTAAEFEQMKKHTVFGREVVDKIQTKTKNHEFMEYAKIITEYHHEKWDGTGYPTGLKGLDIPLPARLMAIVDVYDALVSERPYKKPFSHEEAVRIIEEGRNTQFEPVLVDVFLRAAERMSKFAAN